MSQGDNSLLLGEAAERKESGLSGSQGGNEVNRSKEGWFDNQGQGVTRSSSRPGQGKVVASMREAFECKEVCGEKRKGGGSNR